MVIKHVIHILLDIACLDAGLVAAIACRMSFTAVRYVETSSAK